MFRIRQAIWHRNPNTAKIRSLRRERKELMARYLNFTGDFYRYHSQVHRLSTDIERLEAARQEITQLRQRIREIDALIAILKKEP